MWMNCNEMNIALRLAFCSHCHRRIVEFSFLLNWIFPLKSFFFSSLNCSFPIESLEIFSIVWNIDTLRHHIVFVNEKIASLFVPFFDSKRCRNMYNVHKFGLCGYFFLFNQSIPSLLFVFLLIFQLNQPIIERLFYNRHILFLIPYQCVQF